MKLFFTSLFIFLIAFTFGQKVELFVPSSNKPVYNRDSSLVLTFNNYQIQVWETFSFKLKTIINLPAKGYGIINYFEKFEPIINPTTNDIIVNAIDSNIYIFNFNDGKLLSQIKTPQLIRAISINKKGNILIASSIYNDEYLNNTNYVFSLKTNQLIWKSHDNGYPDYQFNNDGSRLLIYNSNLSNKKSYTLFKTDSLTVLNDFENPVSFSVPLNLIIEPVYKNMEQYSIIKLYSSITGKFIDSLNLNNTDRGFYTKTKNDYSSFCIEKFIAYHSNKQLIFYNILDKQKYFFKISSKPNEDLIRNILTEIDTLKDFANLNIFLTQKISEATKQANYDDYKINKINDKFFAVEKYDIYNDSSVLKGIEIIDINMREKVLFLPNETKDYRQNQSSFFVTHSLKNQFNIYDAYTFKKLFSSTQTDDIYSSFITILNDSLVLHTTGTVYKVTNFLKNKEYALFKNEDEYAEYNHINILHNIFSTEYLISLLNDKWVSEEIKLGNYKKRYNVNYVSINHKKIINDYNCAWFNSICKKFNVLDIHQICMTKDYTCVIHNGVSENAAVSWDIDNGKFNFYKKNVFNDLGGAYSSGLGQVKINEFIISGPSGNHNSFINGHSIKTGEKLYSKSYGYGISQPCYNKQDCNLYTRDSIYSLQYIYSKSYDTLLKCYLFDKHTKRSKNFVNKNGIYYYDFNFFDRKDILGFYQNQTFVLMNLKNFAVIKRLNSAPTFIDTTDFYYIKKEKAVGKFTKVILIVENLNDTTYHRTFSYIDTFKQNILYQNKNSTYFLSVAKNGKVKRINLGTNEIKKDSFSISNFSSVFFYPQKNLFIITKNNQINFYQLSTGNPLYTYVPLDENNFIVYDEQGHYDATENALQYIYYSCGNKVVPANKTNYKSRVKNLVQKIMSNNQQQITEPTKEQLNICSLIEN